MRANLNKYSIWFLGLLLAVLTESAFSAMPNLSSGQQQILLSDRSDYYGQDIVGALPLAITTQRNSNNSQSNTVFGAANETSAGIARSAQPTITTQATSAAFPNPISDTATLSNGVNPTGTITFIAYGPVANTIPNCTTVAFTSIVSVNGNGTYQPNTPFTPLASGNYFWTASYSGDGLNNGVATSCGDPNEMSASCALITFLTTTLSSGNYGLPYSQTIQVANGTPPYTFSLASGSLPTGLTLSFSGTISGTPTVIGTFTFVIRVTDSSGCTGEQSYTLAISCAPIEFVTTRLPHANLGEYYNHQIVVNGYTPIIFSIEGRLPPGLSLVPTTGAIQGFPRATGRFHFDVVARSACGNSAERRFTIKSRR